MKIDEVIEMLGNLEGIKVDSYSGRGMMGRRCLGIIGEFDDCLRALSEVNLALIEDVYNAAIDTANEEDMKKARNAQREAEDVIRQLAVYNQDQMGRSAVVLYWPRIKYEAPEVEQDEDEEDRE